MKGMFFSKPLEYQLETTAEDLTQGEKFTGSIAVTNRGSDSMPAQLKVGLAYGLLKKIKEGTPDAFQPVEEHTVKPSQLLPPGEKLTGDWSFQLADDCPVTSKEGTLFLLYGSDLNDPTGWSKIDLRISPATQLQGLITVLENHFQFACISSKHDKGFTEFRLKPPGSYPSMEVFLLRGKLNTAGDIELDCRFRMKKLARGTEKGVKTKTEQVECLLASSDHTSTGGQPNRPALQEFFRSLLAEVVPNAPV